MSLRSLQNVLHNMVGLGLDDVGVSVAERVRVRLRLRLWLRLGSSLGQKFATGFLQVRENWKRSGNLSGQGKSVTGK